MDEEKDNELDEELDKDLVDDDKDPDESDDDEFEYDEDGNIIIPDVEEDEEDEDVQEDEEDNADTEDEKQDEKPDEEKNEDLTKSDEVVELEKEKAPDEKDERIAKLEAELKILRSQGKETLSKLGVQTDDVLGGLERLAAEADDIPVEEYRKNKEASQRDEEARQLLQKVEFEKKMKADLEEVQKAYPETKVFTSITQIENFARFGMLRDKGLSPKEAYAAANADSIKKNVATAVKQQSLNETKNHLQSAVPKGSKDNSLKLPKSTLVEWRDLFPGKSDKEIIALYKQSLK